jgi:hypothetical protein
MLCHLCSSIFKGDIEPGTSYDHHASAQDLRQSVEHNCHMCSVLERHLSNVFGVTWDTETFRLEYMLTPEELEAADVPDALWFTCPGLHAHEEEWDFQIRIGLGELESE